LAINPSPSRSHWTTAPAMTVAEGQVLGQDTLTYTPVNYH
jgi:hypothetical protein